jgi:hypothetical protein
VFYHKVEIMETMDNELLTWAEICAKYPNKWVMVGIPESEATLPKDTRKGNVLYALADKKAFTTFSAKTIESFYIQNSHARYFTNYTGELTPATQGKKKRLVGTLKKVQ